jgi:hypothetical protein
MVEKSDPKWKRFEVLVAKLQQEFTPEAKVTFNDKIMGRNSGVPRQIDISVRIKVGQFSLLIVLDCKDYSNPVDVKDVEEFLGLVDDVGANKGALVSSSGFTEAARTRAKNAGIDIYRLIDAENQDWRSYVAIPLVCDFRGLGSGHFKIGGSTAICNDLGLQDPNLIPIYNKNHEQIGTPITLLWAMWNRREISEEPGFRHILIKPDPIFVKAQDSHFEQVEILGEFEVLRKLYFGELPLTKITGLKDEVTGDLVLPGNTEIITDVIDIVDVERNWQHIPSSEVLAVKPVMILTAFDYYPPTVPNNSDTPKDVV